jgi:hypothetical protein
MAGILFTNFARSQLAAPLLAGDLSLTVQTGHGARFPAPGVGDYFYLVLENASLAREIVKCTGRAVDTLTIVRAQDNTTALGWNAGDVVALRFVAAAIADAVTGTAMLTGAAFTGAVSTTSTLAVTGATTLTGLLTANGGVAVPADATGNNARRANQLIWNVGGAAVMPTWTTAGRPATPAEGYTGFNTDLDCNETWHAAYSDWVQDGWQYSAPISLSGLTAQAFTGVPAWVNEVCFHFNIVSSSTTTNARLRLGHAGGLIATNYQSASVYTNMAGASVGAGLTTGVFFYAGATGVGLFGQVRCKRATGNLWDVMSVLNDQVNGVVKTSGWVDVTAPLTQFELALASGTFDSSCSANISWRK